MRNPCYGLSANAFYDRVTAELAARNTPVFPCPSDGVVVLLHYSMGPQPPEFTRHSQQSFWTSGFTRSKETLRNLINWNPEAKTWLTALRFDANQEAQNSSRFEIVRNGKHLSASEVVIAGEIGPEYLCHIPFDPTVELIEP